MLQINNCFKNFTLIFMEKKRRLATLVAFKSNEKIFISLK